MVLLGEIASVSDSSTCGLVMRLYLNVAKFIRIDGTSSPLKTSTSKRANIGVGIFKGGLTSVSSRQGNNNHIFAFTPGELTKTPTVQGFLWRPISNQWPEAKLIDVNDHFESEAKGAKIGQRKLLIICWRIERTGRKDGFSGCFFGASGRVCGLRASHGFPEQGSFVRCISRDCSS